MKINEAFHIMNVYGKYLEVCHGRIIWLFFPEKPPESLLPYPKSIIEKAGNIVAEYYFEVKKDYKTGRKIQEAMACTYFYIEDEVSLISVSNNFCNADKRKQTIKNLKNWQKDWLNTQTNQTLEV